MMMNQVFPIVSVSLILSAVTYLVTPDLGRKLKKMRIVGTDVHKKSSPKIPEMGGIIVLLALLPMIGFVYVLTGMSSALMVLASVGFFGMYGMLDDMKRLGKYQKLALSLAIGLVMLVPVSPGVLMIPLLLVVVVGLGNIFNVFAGFNGLEVGSSSIVAFFFSILCLMTGNLVPFYLSMGLFVILLAFLLHNKYPARIFPGNVGTVTIGGFFAGMCLYYNLYQLIIPLLVLHLSDIALKGASAGFFSSSEKAPTGINGDDILVPQSDYLSLSRLVLKLRPMTEKQLVNFFWGLSILTGISVVTITGVLL